MWKISIAIGVQYAAILAVTKGNHTSTPVGSSKAGVRIGSQKIQQKDCLSMASNPHFLCGENGCDVFFVNEAAHKYAEERLRIWARQQRRLAGEFPPAEEQNDYYAGQYQRFERLKIRKVQKQEKGLFAE